MGRLTHLAEDGTAQMVDVSAKSQSAREAVAAGAIRLRQETLDLISKCSRPRASPAFKLPSKLRSSSRFVTV
jgi:cyclic pyranopterin phosphate synthase